MAIRLPSASSLVRAQSCDGSNVFPRVSTPTSVYSEIGTGVHAYLVRARSVGREEALAEISIDAEHRKFCEAIPLDKLPQGGRMETAYAYDVENDTARVLGNDIGRAYEAHGWNPETEIPGTTDVDGVIGDVAQIVDYKTGFKSLGDPAKSKQLRLLALAKCRELGLDQARVAFWYLRDDGSFHEEAAELNALDLMEIAEELRELVARIRTARERYRAGEQPNVAIGPWCGHCSSLPHCPGQMAIARSIVRFEDPGELTVNAAAQAWAILDAYDLLAERARRSLRDFAKLQPIPVAGDRELRLVDWTTTKLDTTIAKAVIAEKYGDAVAETAVSKTVTQSSIEEAIGGIARSKGEKLAPIKREILESIEQRRGLSSINVPQVRVMKVPKAKKSRKVTMRLDGAGKDAMPVVDVEPEAATA